MSYKAKVLPNPNAPFVARYFHHFWTYQHLQLTTSNVAAMRSADLMSSKDQMVTSDLQPHALYQFPGEDNHSLLVAVPKTSPHYKNILDCERASAMAGHSNPQLFAWFKQLGGIPPRSIMSGKAKLLDPHLSEDVWQEVFVKHPIVHSMAQRMWENDESKTEEEKIRVKKRVEEEDEKRMKRMSDADWRQKHKERERNPSRKEEEEKPIYIMKSDSFGIIRIQPDVQLWNSYTGSPKRVWEKKFPPMDPLARSCHRFIGMSNLSRAKLVASLNMNYTLKLLNAFVFDVDCKGFWAMGTQETLGDAPDAKTKGNKPTENWTEFRIEFGQDQVINDEAEMEWWFKGLFRIGAPESGSIDGSQDDKAEEFDFRHGK